jgi:hypothetical protein
MAKTALKPTHCEPVQAEPLPPGFPDLDLGRDIGRTALAKLDEAARYALVAGQWLNEFQEAVPYGEFEYAVRKYCPWFKNRSSRTLQDWARAAAKVASFVTPPGVDIGLKPSAILWAKDESALPPAARDYRRAWFDLIRDRTIKDCIAGLFGGNNEAHNTDRALNGKMAGGTRGEDRKDYPLYIGVKFKDLSNHFSHWHNYSSHQKYEVRKLIEGLILGEDVILRMDNKSRIHDRTFDFSGKERRRSKAPLEFCDMIEAALRKRRRQER